MKGKTLLWVAALLLGVLVLYGCTSGASYTPCCARDKIYDLSAVPPAVLPNPICQFPDGTLYGGGGGNICNPTSTEAMKGTTECNPDNEQCSSINSESECKKSTTCAWNGLTSECRGGAAYYLLPVCTDAYPKNCTSGVCQAMVCGFASPRVGPQPTANDFRQCSSFETAAECTAPCVWSTIDGKCSGNRVPFSRTRANDVGAIGLQGTYCDFKTMDKKLYNQFTQSRGKLWVNSFRFGVGKSFADFEQSRYFFPPSDRFCAESVLPGRDRFINYVGAGGAGAPGTWCGAMPTNDYYYCQKNKLSFSDEPTCLTYCFGKTGGTDGCIVKTGLTPRYECKDNKFAYEKLPDCQLECQILADPSACPIDPVKFPFLDANGRMKAKLQADYVYSTNDIDSSNTLYFFGGGFKESCKQDNWRQSHDYCDDFYPWQCASGMDDCLWDPPSEDYVQDLTWRDNRLFSLDTDTKWYGETLKSQIPVTLQKGAFECETGLDCLSGACDFSQYKRTVCKSAADPDKLLNCGCGMTGYGALDCGSVISGVPTDPGASRGTFLKIGHKDNFEWLTPSNFKFGETIGKDLDGNDMRTEDAVYYVTGDTNPSTDFRFLMKPDPSSGDTGGCNLAPTNGDSGQLMCLGYVTTAKKVGELPNPFGGTPIPVYDYIYHHVLHPGISTFSDCSASVHSIPNSFYVWSTIKRVRAYQMKFTPAPPSSGRTWGSVGSCKMQSTPSGSAPPYLDTTTFGWCQACTQSTLAVQKVEFGPPNFVTEPGNDLEIKRWAYECFAFRGEYGYEVSTGITGTSADPLRNNGDFNVAPVKKNDVLLGSKQFEWNGNIERGPLDCGIFSGAFGECDTSYFCQDGWGGWDAGMPVVDWAYQSFPRNSWHAITSPSQPYLIEKLRAYMQSSIMPILDFDAYNSRIRVEKYSGQPIGMVPDPTGGPPSLIFEDVYNTVYPPTSLCAEYGADGAIIYNVGDLGFLKSGSADHVYDGEKSPNVVHSAFPNLMLYFDKHPSSWVTGGSGDIKYLNGQASVIYRALMLKKTCRNPPLAAISISGYEPLDVPGNPDNLIGYKDASGDFHPGILHSFFYSKIWGPSDEPKYAQRLLYGQPDKYADNIDLILQEWHPTCSVGSTPEERIQKEFESRLSYSRAFLANFSKPTLIWKFDVPDPANSKCRDDDGKFDTFFNYMFDHQADMVDAGIVGVVYDNWLTQNGDAYLNSFPGGGEWRGTTSGIIPAAQGPLDTLSGKNTNGNLFCALQQATRKVQGLEKKSYAQKVYANSEGACQCRPCTQQDRTAGACVPNPTAPEVLAEGNELAQMYCLGGQKCAMPVDSAGITSTDYPNYVCPQYCLSNSCNKCDSSVFSGSQIYCKIDSAEKTYQLVKKYSDPSDPSNGLADTDWDLIASLPDKDKCCLSETVDGEEMRYTYISRSGAKEKSELLQFPKRGDPNTDCGRPPNTNLLKDCGVNIPSNDRQVYCTRVG